MKSRLRKSAEKNFWIALPFLSSLLLILLSGISFKIFYLDVFFPFLSLAAIYYWCIVKPDMMPAVLVFLLGLIQDIISGGPLGMTAFLLLLVRIFVLYQGRRFLEREFLFSWLFFAVVAPVFGLMSWGVASFYLKDIQNIGAVVGQSLLTILFFPAVVWALSPLRKLLREGR